MHAHIANCAMLGMWAAIAQKITSIGPTYTHQSMQGPHFYMMNNPHLLTINVGVLYLCPSTLQSHNCLNKTQKQTMTQKCAEHVNNM